MAIEKDRLKEKYKKFLVFYSIIVLLFVVNSTFSRYIATTSGNGTIGVAKFQVKVNGESISEGRPFDIILSPNANTYNDKMAPDSKGYFEIVIDPSGTEVSLEYKFTFDFSKISNNIKLKKCEASDPIEVDVANSTVRGTLNLSGANQGFTGNNITNMKVCWEWKENNDVINPIIPETTVVVTALVQQKIN